MKSIKLQIIIMFACATFVSAQKPCQEAPTVSYGGQVYKTESIGKQCWLKENLNIGKMISSDEKLSDNQVIEKYCYDNDESNCKLYGGLYSWNEMMKYEDIERSQGICPNGWHIPSDGEFKALEMFEGLAQDQADLTGGRGKIAQKLIYSKFRPGTFDAKFAGNKAETGDFADFNVVSYFWTSTLDKSGKNAYARYFIVEDAAIYRDQQPLTRAFSIRCLKD